MNRRCLSRPPRIEGGNDEDQRNIVGKRYNKGSSGKLGKCCKGAILEEKSVLIPEKGTLAGKHEGTARDLKVDLVAERRTLSS